MKRAVFVLAFLVPLSACSNQLSRRNAAELISRRLGDKTDSWLDGTSVGGFIHVGRIGRRCEEVHSQGRREITEVGRELTQPDYPEYKALQRLGFIDIRDVGASIQEVVLTEKGRRFFSEVKEEPYARVTDPKHGCDYQQLDVPLAERRMEGVTGISTRENLAEVEYRWKYKTTPVGDLLTDESDIYKSMSEQQRMELRELRKGKLPIHSFEVANGRISTAHFQLYDDGWRLLDVGK